MDLRRSIENIYQIAPPNALNRLLGFRERVPVRNHSIGKNLYPVWDIGQGERAMVFLPSGMGNGEIFFPFLTELSADIRCVAISLPACKTMDEYAREIHQLLQELGVSKLILVGHAIGGILAQVYARLYPEQVEGLALCMSGAPCRGLSTACSEKWTRRRKVYLRYRIAPFNNMKQRMAFQAFYNMCPPELEDNLMFWRAYIAETYDYKVYKAQYLHLNFLAVPEIYTRLPFYPGDMQGWNGRVLLVEADGDQYYAEEEKAALRSLYPSAQIQRLGHAGQLALQADEREAVLLLRAFAKQV